MTAQLSVNLNAIAMLRNRRNLPWPSVTGMGRVALEAGAIGLTVHPRPDERHIRRSDVPELAALVAEFKGAEFNIEGYPDEAFLALCESVQCHQVTLVPDDPSQSTSDHGWDFGKDAEMLKSVVARLQAGGMRTALFINPNPHDAVAAKAVGADRVELFTGPYGACLASPHTCNNELQKLADTAAAAARAGLGVNAGHDLTLENIPALIKACPNILEASIGHGLTADCLIYGMERAVKMYREALGGD
jgi:pyridoxine 5-phosphate synthase